MNSKCYNCDIIKNKEKFIIGGKKYVWNILIIIILNMKLH